MESQTEKEKMKNEIKKREFIYRGKNIEELKKLSVREFAKYLKSRPRRYVLRQFQKIENFIIRAKNNAKVGKPIKTHYRDLVITPEMIGMKIFVHNGKTFLPVDITEEMLGHRLGEFSLTRGKVKHSKAGIGATKGSKFKAKK